MKNHNACLTRSLVEFIPHRNYWRAGVTLCALFLVSGLRVLHAAPAMLEPADGAELTGESATFTWSDDERDVDAWILNVGSWPGGRDIASSTQLTNQHSLLVAGLPQDGTTIHARLFAWTNGQWLISDRSFVSLASQADRGGSCGGGSLITGKDDTPPASSWRRPDLGSTYIDPVYDTSVRRMTDAGGTRFDRNIYSRRQAENADGTLFMTYHGTARYRIYQRESLELVRELDIHPDAEPQWHASDADIVRHIKGPNAGNGDLRLYETSVSSGQTRGIADLTARLRAQYPAATHMKDNAEGSPSANGNRYAWIVYDAGQRPLALVSYDLATDKILGTRALRTDVGRLDWVSMSPTGSYVMAGYVNATTVHGSDLADERRVNDKADHSDIALDRAGRDAYVYIDFSSGTDGGWLVSVDLATLQRTRLIDFYDQANTSLHVSGKGYSKPGWVVISTYNCKVDGAWSCNKVFAVEMSSSPTIVNLAHTYNCGDNYWTETHAVVNRDFTRVYYNSDAGRCTTEAEVYEASVPRLP